MLDGDLWSSHPAWVILEDLPAWKTVVPIPDDLRKSSDIVESLRNRDDSGIQRLEKSRALRIIEALVREARARGYVSQPTPATRHDRWGYANYDRSQGYLTMTIDGDEYALSVLHPNERVPHVMTKADAASFELGEYVPSHDAV